MNNKITEHLETIAKLKAMNGASNFSVGAYERAAKAIREMREELTTENISSIPGAGAKIRACVQEFLELGNSAAYEELAEKQPVECLSLCTVQGIGAKKAKKF